MGRAWRSVLLGLVWPCLAAAASAADLEGRVVVDVPGLDAAAVAPVVVYLAPPDGAPLRDAGRAAAVLRQRRALFTPPFLVVAVGQPVEMPNEDGIFHNAFSFSAPNQFDLGLYPAGESRTVRFDHPGVVRIYCSIHESMNATLFVSPTPWFAVADREGRFRISGVPSGGWRLRTWTESLPDTTRTLRLPEAASGFLEVPVGATGAD
jgi:plastocyanin